MSRNDLVFALIRVFGVVLLVYALLQIPVFAIQTFVTLFEMIRTTIRVSFEFAFEHFPFANMITSLVTLALQIVLGYYLMCGGAIFARKATQE